MKITIESTDEIAPVMSPTGPTVARVWRGTTEKGTEVAAYVVAVQTPIESDPSEFSDLETIPDPRLPEPESVS